MRLLEQRWAAGKFKEVAAATDVLIRGGGDWASSGDPAAAAAAAVAKKYILRLLATPRKEVSWTRADVYASYVLRHFAKRLSTKEYNIILRAVTRGR